MPTPAVNKETSPESFYKEKGYPEMKDRLDNQLHRFNYDDMIEFAEAYGKMIASLTWDACEKHEYVKYANSLHVIQLPTAPDKETFINNLFEK